MTISFVIPLYYLTFAYNDIDGNLKKESIKTLTLYNTSAFSLHS